MSILFVSANEVDSHNKSRQSNLAPEKFWVTQCICIRLCTTVSMGMAITIWWKLFFCGVKRCHYEKLIDIREVLELLDIDCFNNTFSNDTGAPENNIPPLDEFDYRETVSTCHGRHYSSSNSSSTEVSTILELTLTVLHRQPIFWWILLLNLSILMSVCLSVCWSGCHDPIACSLLGGGFTIPEQRL